MPRPSRPWFRFYVEAVHDRKLRRVTPAQRWLWVAVLAAARASPVPGVLLISEREAMDDSDVADQAGMPLKEVARTMPIFEQFGMLHRVTEPVEAWAATHWDDRQPESDDVTQRTRKHRSNHPHRDGLGTFQRRSQERPFTNGDESTSTLQATLSRATDPETPYVDNTSDSGRQPPDQELPPRRNVPKPSRDGLGTVLGTMTEVEADTEKAAAGLTGTHDTPGNRPAAAAERPSADNLPSIEAAAIEELARRAAARAQNVKNPDGYIHGTVLKLRAQHRDQLLRWHADHYNDPTWTPDQLADWLDPSKKPERSSTIPGAFERPPCDNPECDHGWIETGNGRVLPCPACTAGSKPATAAFSPARPAPQRKVG